MGTSVRKAELAISPASFALSSEVHLKPFYSNSLDGAEGLKVDPADIY